MKKNFESMHFLRNGKLFLSHAEALTNISINSSKVGDGEALLARYKDENDVVKTIVGYKYEMNGESSLTIIDIEGFEKAINDAENKIPDVSGFINSVEYEEDGNNHSIIFYHDNVVIDSIDATPFLIDGMIENIFIEDGYLVIDFNTASGKEDIHIPLSDIFNPNAYYTKDETSGATEIQTALEDKLDATAYTPTDLSNYYTKDETSGATEIATALEDKLDVTAYTPTDLTDYYTKSETSGATEISDALDTKASVTDDLDNIKLKKITSSDYNALVDAGTVDPNTLYIVTD